MVNDTDTPTPRKPTHHETFWYRRRVGLRLIAPDNTVFAGSSATLAVITQLQPITVVFNV